MCFLFKIETLWLMSTSAPVLFSLNHTLLFIFFSKLFSEIIILVTLFPLPFRLSKPSYTTAFSLFHIRGLFFSFLKAQINEKACSPVLNVLTFYIAFQ